MRAKFITIAAGAALVTMLAWSPAVLAQQKTVKQCRAEWTANKTAIAASGKTQRAFVAQCRGVPLVARSIPAVDLGQGQYADETDAKSACGSDAVVWVNLRSRAYHEASSRNYGATKAGAYMCEKESLAAGFHAARAFARPPVKDMLPSQPPAKPGSGMAGACLAVRRGDKGGGKGG